MRQSKIDCMQGTGRKGGGGRSSFYLLISTYLCPQLWFLFAAVGLKYFDFIVVYVTTKHDTMTGLMFYYSTERNGSRKPHQTYSVIN